MNLSKLLSTKEREKALNEVLFKQEDISVADISRSLKLSKGFISRFFTMLSKQKIIKKSKNRYIVLENLNVKLLRIAFNLKPFADFNFKKYRLSETGGRVIKSAN